jgi:hypothetical protein
MLAPIILKHRFGVHRGGCAGAARVSNKGQSLLSIVRRDEQDRKARRSGERICLWRSMDFSLMAVGRVTSLVSPHGLLGAALSFAHERPRAR